MGVKTAETPLGWGIEIEAMFRLLADNIREVFWLHDQIEGRILYVSASYDRIWGRSRDLLLVDDLGWTRTIHPAERERVQQAFVEKAPLGLFDEEYRIVRPNGTIRWIRDRGVPIEDGSGTVTHVAGIAEDISERRTHQARLLDTIAQEQQRISRDLHDSIGQQLAGLSYMAKASAQRLDDAGSSEAPRLEELAGEIGRARAAVQDAIRGLTPVAAESGGLMASLRDLAARTERQFGTRCRFECPTDVEVDDRSVATHLFRIAQEAVTNAVRHADAQEIVIDLDRTGQEVVLRLRDDGRGLPTPTPPGMGLDTMRHRASVIGASLDVSNSPRGGVEVVCRVGTSG